MFYLLKEQHFNTTPFSSLQDVDDYSEKSNSSINYLILETLGMNEFYNQFYVISLEIIAILCCVDFSCTKFLQ